MQKINLPELPLEFHDNEQIIKCKREKQKYYDPFHQEITSNLHFTSKYEMPKVNAYLNDIPRFLLSYPRRNETKRVDCALHFYIHDFKFTSIITQPYKCLNTLKKYVCVIGPDFSVQPQMPLPEKIKNVYDNKKVTAWWQFNGVNVIPNIVWCNNIDYEICFDGFPKHSVIAINSTGLGHDIRSKHCWIDGYKKAIDILEPSTIIRYGAKQDGENESISYYYENDNKNGGNYGR